MKETGIVRRIDKLGRVVLPIELRRQLNLDIQDPVEILLDNGNIVLRKHETACVFCNGTKDIHPFRGKMVCEECARMLMKH